MKDIGELNYFLSVKVIQDLTDGKVWLGKVWLGKVWLGQTTFTESVLKKYGI